MRDLLVLLLVGSIIVVLVSGIVVPGGALPARATETEEAVAFVRARAISRSHLDEALENRLAPVRYREYQIRRAVLDDIIDRTLLREEAERLGTTPTDLEEREVVRKMTPMTQQELEAKYETLRNLLPPMSKSNAMRLLADGLNRSRLKMRRRDYLGDLRSKASVKLLLPVPRVDVPDTGSPHKGPTTAPVRIVQFSDYQCPACAQLSQTLSELEARYTGKVSFVFKDFPLSTHDRAPRAAEAARCAGEQGAYWSMHERLFTHQQDLGDSALRTHAAVIGVNVGTFSHCLDTGRNAMSWQQDKKLGESLGVTSTPTIFLNGRFISGAPTLEELVEIVDEELRLSSDTILFNPKEVPSCSDSATNPCGPLEPRR